MTLPAFVWAEMTRVGQKHSMSICQIWPISLFVR